MHKLKFVLLFISCMMIVSCGDDPEEQFLNYDGDNVTGPVFNPGAYVTAVRFPANIMSIYRDDMLTAVDIYIVETPTSARLTILSGDGSSNTPTGEITGQSLGALTPNSWNTITLNQPYQIDGSEIWIGLDFNVTSSIMVTGCDAGPANANGDYLFQDSDNEWTTFRDLTITESINWNIRGILSI